MATQGDKQIPVLVMSTIAFTICFAVWMVFAVIGIPIRKALDLNATQFGLLTATPVLTGSLVRVPLGLWTDRYGGRIVFFLLMLSTVIPIWLLSYATEYWHFLVLGLFVGLAGGSFSVGTPYVARWFRKERQGFAMGVFGAGNSGAALTKFVAPAIVVAAGWTMVPKVYAVAMLVTAVAFWLRIRRIRSARGSRGASSSPPCAIRRCGSTASTTRSSSAATSRSRCGWCSTT
jgi:MFS transporter, NNP family, nitrate/nitrite transporter